MSLNETLNLLSYIQDIYNIDLLEVPCSCLDISDNDYNYYVMYHTDYDILTFTINKDNVASHFE